MTHLRVHQIQEANTTWDVAFIQDMKRRIQINRPTPPPSAEDVQTEWLIPVSAQSATRSQLANTCVPDMQ